MMDLVSATALFYVPYLFFFQLSVFYLSLYGFYFEVGGRGEYLPYVVIHLMLVWTRRPSLIEKDPESRLAGSVGLRGRIPDPRIAPPRIGFPQANGGNADVYICVWKWPGGKTTVVAVKVLRGAGLEVLEQRAHREVAILARLKDKNMLPCYGTIRVYGYPIGIVSPWIEEGSLTKQLCSNYSVLSYPNRMKIILQVAGGLLYLHENNIVHGDVNGNNILVDANGTVFLFDFGLSYVQGVPERSSPPPSQCTVAFSAPEILIDGQRPTTRSDIYSFGSLMLHVLIGYWPYGKMHTYVSFAQGRYHPRRPESCIPITDELWDFMMDCWSTTPQDRPSAQEVYGWLTSYASV